MKVPEVTISCSHTILLHLQMWLLRVTFTISGDKLLVAGGRTVPAAFDLKTGEELYYKLAESGKTGGAFTCGNDRSILIITGNE